MNDGQKEIDFEKKLAEIESLLESFKDENLTLQESLKAYKKGDKLIKEASEILENAKASIKEIDSDD